MPLLEFQLPHLYRFPRRCAPARITNRIGAAPGRTSPATELLPSLLFFRNNGFVESPQFSIFLAPIGQGSRIASLLGLELQVVRQPPLLKLPRINRGLQGTTNVALVIAVSKPTVPGNFQDVVEQVGDALLAISQLQFAHSRIVDQPTACGQTVHGPCGRRVPTFGVVFPN